MIRPRLTRSHTVKPRFWYHPFYGYGVDTRSTNQVCSAKDREAHLEHSTQTVRASTWHDMLAAGSTATSHDVYLRVALAYSLYIVTSASVLAESTQAHLHYQVEYSTKA